MTDVNEAWRARGPKRRDIFDQSGLKDYRSPAPTGVGDVTEGAHVASLLFVFKQLEAIDVRRQTG